MKRPGIRIIREPYVPPRPTVENLRYSIDVYDANGNLIEVLGRLADLEPARAAFKACCAKDPDKHIFLRQGARVIRRSDEPKD
jgi:hypothetical protein